MSRWPSAKHFTSWLALSPGNKITGGKVLSSRTKPYTSRVAQIFRGAAVSVGRTQTALGAFYRRIATRSTHGSEAVTATARKIAVLVYTALKTGNNFIEPGATFYEERYRERGIRNLERRAKTLGFQLLAVSPPPTPST